MLAHNFKMRPEFYPRAMESGGMFTLFLLKGKDRALGGRGRWTTCLGIGGGDVSVPQSKRPGWDEVRCVRAPQPGRLQDTRQSWPLR